MARKETIDQKITRLEEKWTALDKEIFDINMLVAAKRVPFAKYPRWAEAYNEIGEVERQLAKLKIEEEQNGIPRNMPEAPSSTKKKYDPSKVVVKIGDQTVEDFISDNTI